MGRIVSLSTVRQRSAPGGERGALCGPRSVDFFKELKNGGTFRAEAIKFVRALEVLGGLKPGRLKLLHPPEGEESYTVKIMIKHNDDDPSEAGQIEKTFDSLANLRQAKKPLPPPPTRAALLQQRYEQQATKPLPPPPPTRAALQRHEQATKPLPPLPPPPSRGGRLDHLGLHSSGRNDPARAKARREVEALGQFEECGGGPRRETLFNLIRERENGTCYKGQNCPVGPNTWKNVGYSTCKNIGRPHGFGSWKGDSTMSCANF